MADVRGIYTIDRAGTATLVKNLEDGTGFFAVRDSVTITPAPRKQVMAAGQNRYEGSVQVGETHDNGTYTWQCLVAGSSIDDALTKAEALIGVGEAFAPGRYLGWSPAGATNISYCEIRGAFTFKPGYQPQQFVQTKTWVVDVSVPVAPLVRKAALQSISISSTTMPATVALGSSITGNAPALADISLRTSGGSAAPIWALIAWWKRVTATPLSGSVAPIGIIEAESGTMTTWSSVANAAYRGGNGAQATTSGAGTAQTLITVDPSVLTPDDFTQNTVDIEVWVDYRIASTVVSPRLIASMTPTSGFGATRYTELGASGRLLTLPASGTVKRLTRLGVLTMPVDPLTPVKWDLKIAASWAAGSSGAFGADYVMLVPARQRACSRTGVANDSGFPKFIASTSDTTKTVRADLSGAVASATANAGADTGLGGSRLWLPPGNVDLLVKLSSTVPDDPTVDASDEQLSHTSVTGAVSLVTRYWLAV